MGIKTGDLREDFTIREAAYHFMEFDTFNRKKLQKRQESLSNSDIEAEKKEGKLLQDQLNTAEEIYTTLRRELGKKIRKHTQSSLDVSRQHPPKANMLNKNKISYSRTYISRTSLQIWFAEKGYKTNQFSYNEPLQDEIIYDVKIQQMRLLYRYLACTS